MSEMIERVARAMWEDVYTSPWGSPMDANLTEEYRSQAAVAIKAMREPTFFQMSTAYQSLVSESSKSGDAPMTDARKLDRIRGVYMAMIDEALKSHR